MKTKYFLWLIVCIFYAAIQSNAQNSDIPEEYDLIVIGDTTGKWHFNAINSYGGGVFQTNDSLEMLFLQDYGEMSSLFVDHIAFTEMRSRDTISIWWKLYCQENGSIEGIIIRIKSVTPVPESMRKSIYEAAQEFMQQDRFTIQSDGQKYSQCGPMKIVVP